MTNKLIEAADRLESIMDEHCMGNARMDGDEFLVDMLTEALTAYRSARESAGEVKVKALVWRLDDNVWYAESVFGEYNFTMENAHIDDGFSLYLGDQEVSADNLWELSSAKAAAQADYETRIRSALAE